MEERGLTRYKHGWVTGRTRRMGSFGGVICDLQYTYFLRASLPLAVFRLIYLIAFFNKLDLACSRRGHAR